MDLTIKGMDLPVRQHDLPASVFPFTIEAYHPETKKVVWSHRAEGPGQIYIPALKRQLGHPAAIRIIYADGRVEEKSAPSA
jgi:hypothetical protein